MACSVFSNSGEMLQKVYANSSYKAAFRHRARQDFLTRHMLVLELSEVRFDESHGREPVQGI